MQGRTCILVTHNLALCVPQSSYVVYLDNGVVDIQGSAAKVIASGKLGDDVNMSRPGSAIASQMPSRVPSSLGNESEDTTLVDDGGHSNGNGSSKAAKSKNADKGAKQDAMKETKAEGGVKWNVVVLYLNSMGPWYVILCHFLFTQAKFFQHVVDQAHGSHILTWKSSFIFDSPS